MRVMLPSIGGFMSNGGFYVFTNINSASVELKEEPRLFDLIRMKMHIANMCGMLGTMSATNIACVSKTHLREQESVIEMIKLIKKSLTPNQKQLLRETARKFNTDRNCSEIQYLIEKFKEFYEY
jgi:hypothetical protein